jgi:hypothetical protein
MTQSVRDIRDNRGFLKVHPVQRQSACILHLPADTVVSMSKVIQVRDVPDDVHDALVAEAEGRGLSLTKFLLMELEQVARRPRVTAHNMAIIREGQKRIKGKVPREVILEVIHEARGE